MIEISKTDMLNRLEFDNPWWDSPEEPIAFQSEPRRNYFRPFFDAVLDRTVRRAIVLMGPRRVGKTVMVYQAVRGLIDNGINPERILYLSLETPIYTGLGLEQLLKLYMERNGLDKKSEIFVFFDEVQYLKNWEVHLKSLVDSFPAFKFAVTGSAAAALRLKSAESGAGRFSNYVLPPLSFAEYLSFIGREDELITVKQIEDEEDPGEFSDMEYTCVDINSLNIEFVNYLNFGGYPEAVFSERIRSNSAQFIKSDIIDKVLLRDLPSLYGINDIQELNRLFTTLAYNTGNEVNLEGLSKSSGVAKNTIKRYLDYLEAAFLIKRVERIDHNAKKFQRAVTFKVYLTNPSMRAALFGQVGPDDPAMGSLVETAIYSQWQHSKSISLYYARWNKGEIDIVYMPDGTFKPGWAVEVKWTDKPFHSRSELSNCVEFAKNHPSLVQPILITSRTVHQKHIEHEGCIFDFFPASVYAYILGANIFKDMAHVDV